MSCDIVSYNTCMFYYLCEELLIKNQQVLILITLVLSLMYMALCLLITTSTIKL